MVHWSFRVCRRVLTGLGGVGEVIKSTSCDTSPLGTGIQSLGNRAVPKKKALHIAVQDLIFKPSYRLSVRVLLQVKHGA